MTRKTGLIAALDTQNAATAQAWAQAVAPSAGAVKLGLEFAYAAGFQAVADVAGATPLFLDLKLHDIPNTVAAAIQSLSSLRPKMLTLHASGGLAMMEAARKACDEAFPADARPALLAVTVLTSLDDHALAETGVMDGARAQVLRLASWPCRLVSTGWCAPRMNLLPCGIRWGMRLFWSRRGFALPVVRPGTRNGS